jgi:hypothetical protein
MLPARAARGRRWLAVVAGAMALSVLLAATTACRASAEHTGGGERGVWGPVLVYLSGLDDHHLEAYETVSLHRDPGGLVVAQAPTDSLAWAHDQAGGWLEVEMVDNPDLRGWVSDYHVRGSLHLVDPAAPGCPVPAGHLPGRVHDQVAPSTQVRLIDLADAAPDSWVLVRTLPGGDAWWVRSHHLSERAGPDVRRFAPDTPCEEIPAATPAPHHH